MVGCVRRNPEAPLHLVRCLRGLRLLNLGQLLEVARWVVGGGATVAAASEQLCRLLRFAEKRLLLLRFLAYAPILRSHSELGARRRVRLATLAAVRGGAHSDVDLARGAATRGPGALVYVLLRAGRASDALDVAARDGRDVRKRVGLHGGRGHRLVHVVSAGRAASLNNGGWIVVDGGEVSVALAAAGDVLLEEQVVGGGHVVVLVGLDASLGVLEVEAEALELLEQIVVHLRS